MTNPDNGAFKVHLSGAVADRLRRLRRQAAQRGKGKAFALAWGPIVRSLRRDPQAGVKSPVLAKATKNLSANDVMRMFFEKHATR
jgi:hypothetical protein